MSETMKLGTVIRCPQFADPLLMHFDGNPDTQPDPKRLQWTSRHYRGRTIYTRTEKKPSSPERERRGAVAIEYGSWARSVSVTADTLNTDQTRGDAEWVIEDVAHTSGSQSLNDGYYPGYTTYRAKRLHADGTYDPEGETVTFDTADWTPQVVRHMTVAFTATPP